MSDYNSSLPTRTQNDGDVVVKVADGTTPSQHLKVESDGSININDNGGSLTVDASDLDIRDLAFATDKVDASGSEVSLDATTLAALESVTVQNAGGASAVNIQDGGNTISVDAVNLDIRDLVAATDSVSAHLKDEAGNAFSESNPLWVIQSETAGVEVHNYSTAAAIAANATSNHDYTSGAQFSCKKVMCSASGKAKFELQFETASGSGTFVTKAVQFNSTANPNCEFTLVPAFVVPSGAKTRVIRTNKDNQAQDLYSTIMGVE
jgi:hypothetical protein